MQQLHTIDSKGILQTIVEHSHLCKCL